MTATAKNRELGPKKTANRRVGALSLLTATAALLVFLPLLPAEEPSSPPFDTNDLGVPHADPRLQAHPSMRKC